MTWLAGFAMVALLSNYRGFQPFSMESKAYAVHLAGLIAAILLLLDFAASPVPLRFEWRLLNPVVWAGTDLRRWAVVFVTVYAVSLLISTLLSPLPAISFLGASPNRVGGELYTQLSTLVLFIAVAVKMRCREQAFRLVGVIVAVGTVSSAYGVLQHFKLDLLRGNVSSDRVISTLGNPISFGAILVMTMPLTLGLVLMHRREWPAVGFLLVSIVLGVQIAALWFTQSRGPLLASFVAMAAFLVGTALWRSRSELRLAALAFGIAVLLGVVIILTPGGASSTRSVSQMTLLGGQFDVLAERAQPADQQDGGGYGGGLLGRSKIWRGVLNLSTSWDWPEPEHSVRRALRPLFGFGPDMLVHSFPLKAEPIRKNERVTHAHNLGLQILTEQGWFGLLSLLAAAGAIFAVAVRRLVIGRAGGPDEYWRHALFVALLAALTGRVVEQLVGVAQAPDILLSWMLAGAVVALSATGRAGSPMTGNPNEASEGRLFPWRALVSTTLAVAVAIAGAVVFLRHDVRQLQAGVSMMSIVRHLETTGELDLDGVLDAVRKSPFVERYHLDYAAVERDEAQWRFDQADLVTARTLARQGLEVAREYADRNPYATDSQRMMASLALDLHVYGDSEAAFEAVALSQGLTTLAPNVTSVLEESASALIDLNEPDQALDVTNTAIALESQVGPLPRARWTRGEALLALGYEGDARRAFEESIARGWDPTPRLRAFLARAEIEEALGNPDMAQRLRELAREQGAMIGLDTQSLLQSSR